MLVAICFFLSGAAALILQVLWTRMLGHVFGATALAVSTTLTVFMGGLALGSHYGGKWAPRLKHPLLAFAVLETAVGFYGLIVPSVFEALPNVQRHLGLDLGPGLWGYALLRFLVVALVLLLPTTAMGATLPVLAQGVVERSEHLASRVGSLYAANTLGAVVGAFGAGFVLIPELGLSQTVRIAAGIDLLVALTVLGLFRFGGEALLLRRRQEETPDEILNRLEPIEPVRLRPAELHRVLVVYAASGGSAMALEVLWSRAVGVVIGASTYSFTLILVTFLVGLAVGAAVISRRIDRIADPLRILAYVQLGIGATTLLAMVFIDRLPLWLHAVARSQGVTNADLYVTNFLITGSATLPTTLLLGAVMPLVVKAITPAGRLEAGPVVGRAYAVNTLGAIFGSFAGGFLILPFLGVERGLVACAVLNLLLGAYLVASRPAEWRRAGVLLLCGLMFTLVRPSWDLRSWTAGLFRMYLARSVYAGGWAPSGRIIYHRDGIATTVTVDQQEDGVGISMKVNGKVDASDIGDMPTQVLSGLLPILLHPDPKSVLVIGYGSGVTPGAVLQAPIERLQVAELEEAVYEAANTHFAHVNHQPKTDPRATLTVDDGRNFLLTRDQKFDVIISEPSNPWMSGAASLFTTDFFKIAKGRLAEQGLFLQWFQLYELAPSNIHALVRTFHSVFPHVLIFSPSPTSNDTLLIGSDRPVQLDRAQVAKLLSDPRLKAELLRANVEVPEDFWGLFLVGTDEIDQFVGDGPLNTDDNALIEFAAPKDLLDFALEDPRLNFVKAIEGKRMEIVPKYFRGFEATPDQQRQIGDRLLRQGRTEDATAFLKAAQEGGADVARLSRILEYTVGGDEQPVVIANDQTRNDEDYARSAYLMMQGEDRDALNLFESVKDLEERSLAHRFLYAFLCYRRDRLLDADYLLKKVLEDEAFTAGHPMVLFYAGRTKFYRGRYAEAVKLLERFDDLSPPPAPTPEEPPSK